MKKWPLPSNVKDFQEPATPLHTPERVPVVLKCVGCRMQAEMMFDGTTYCEKCLNEALRTGKA